jgi:hypothetical protein
MKEMVKRVNEFFELFKEYPKREVERPLPVGDDEPKSDEQIGYEVECDEVVNNVRRYVNSDFEFHSFLCKNYPNFSQMKWSRNLLLNDGFCPDDTLLDMKLSLNCKEILLEKAQEWDKENSQGSLSGIEKYPTFNFDVNKIIVHCNSINNNRQAIEYLEWIQKEFKLKNPNLDQDGLNVWGRFNAEIQYRTKLINQYGIIESGQQEIQKNNNLETMGIDFNSKEIINTAMGFETVEKQLAYLTDRYLIAKKQVEGFSYAEWVRIYSIDEKIAYEHVADDPDDGHPVLIETEWDKYEQAKEYLEYNFAEFSKKILPHIEMKRKILKIPAKQKEENDTKVNDNKPEGKTPDPIIWNKKAPQLVYLLESLKTRGFLSQAVDVAGIIRDHFRDTEGKEFKNIHQVKRNALNPKNKRGVREKPILDEIMDDTQKK